MLEFLTFWKFQTPALAIAAILGIYYLLQAYTSIRLPIVGDIISRKNMARNVGIGLLGGALLFSGAFGVSLGVGVGPEEPAAGNIIDTEASSTNHVSQVKDSEQFIQVQYYWDSANSQENFSDDTALDNVVFDLIANRVDFDTGENDRTIVWKFERQDTWENDEKTDPTTQHILAEDSDGNPQIYFDGTQADKGVRVAPASSGTVEVDMDIATGWGDEIEAYSSKSVYVTVEDAASGQSETWEIEFLRTS